MLWQINSANGLVVISFTFCSCSKDSASLNTTNQWSINGVTYKGEAANYDYNGDELWTVDTTYSGFQYVAAIFFPPSFSLAPVSKTFTVVNASTTLASNQCALSIAIGGVGERSLGGGTVNVTVAAGNEISASFSNVVMSINDTASCGTLSGNLSGY